ncbi:exonuclease SbcCD subunit D [Cereibacter sphaeroides]|uniref:exonuclease SbcCD subunit D n=1 Tax=Cereibacter sphaeroides TaxID=1063 RepID=UPI001F2533B6|nr:exonuclease SbcCD subunit D [Cereibacter sphaeroides]MCE6957852.1 exonuclease SbcCD subunit D [Cereibacter sphaeroides]MCE6971821.1 exonuclease SbcCD subunit D [Cereibacter sphaeroides]
MRVLHTADWHIGQTLNGWSREAEHRIWLEELAQVVAAEEVDVLLVTGDVYDGISPTAAAQSLLYRALRRLKDVRPSLVTVITSGNHDPAHRLQAPGPILESLGVHVVATVRRQGGTIDAAAHMIPLPDGDGTVRAWACAIPFLRTADLPGLSFTAEEGRASPIVEAARRFHALMGEAAEAVADGLPVIGMGHLHCRGATESEGSERRILIGNEHALPHDVFPEIFSYVALGHLHQPQSLAGGRIRYSGSCFPLSAAEIGYDHGVTLIDIGEGRLEARHLPIAPPARMLRLPARGMMDLAQLEEALGRIEVPDDLEKDLQPLVYVHLEATGPASVLLAEAERMLAGAPVRTAGIRVSRAAPEEREAPLVASLRETTPEDLFLAAFRKTNATDPEDRHVAAFREAMLGE